MRIDVQEIRTTSKKKIVLIVIVVLLVIFSSIIFGIVAAKKYNKNKIDIILEESKTEENIVNQTEEVENVINTDKQNEDFNKKRIENINGIYKSDKKIAYLTFDDGPSKSVTPLILDVLKDNNIKATFFVLGRAVKDNPELVKRAYEEGHYIANHGYSHVYSSIYKSVDSVIEEYNRTEKEIRKAIGIPEYNSFLFRFPGGSVGGEYNEIKKKAIKELEKQNIAYLDWNALTRDAEGKFTKEELLQNLKSTVKNKKSVVILSHDASTKILTYEILQDEIDYLKKEGYQFGDMNDLMNGNYSTHISNNNKN